MPKSSRIIENIKSVILVVLLIKTILLLYFVWGDFSLRADTGGNERLHVAVDPIEMFQPSRLEVSFGGGVHTVITDTNEKFALLMDCFRTFSIGRSLAVEELRLDGRPVGDFLFQEIKRTPSITAVFDYFLPFSALIELYGFDRISGADNIVAISEVTHVFGRDHELFVRDAYSGRYFSISGARVECFARLRDALPDRPTPSEIHMQVTALAGILNNTLWPISPESNLHDISFSRENFFLQENETSSVAKDFFGGNLNFVRRIIEQNGAIKYIYGYGEIVLLVHPGGRIEYTRAASITNRRNAQIGYLDAFEKANAFIARHGGVFADEEVAVAPYLTKVLQISQNGLDGFRFVFGIRIGDGRVHFQSGDAMIIEVLPSGVSYFQKHMINIDVNQAITSQRQNRHVFFPISNLIAHNEEYVRDVLIGLNRIVARYGSLDTAEEQDTIFQLLVTNVTRLESGYVKIDEEENVLKAAWILTIAGVDFYFEIEDGYPLGYRIQSSII